MLNGTFLVQAIHFFIAYLILERLLLRPAVREIKTDQLEKKHLKDALDAQDRTVKALEQTRQAAWQAACEQFMYNVPSLPTVLTSVVAQELPTIPVLAPEKKAKIIDECVETLLKEVEHVH